MSDKPLPGEEGADAEVSNGAFRFAGKTLMRFSFDRQAAWQRMNAVASAESDLLIIFLCMTDAEEVRSIRYEDEKNAYLSKMAQWCEIIGITIDKDNEGRREANRIATQIASDLKKTSFRPIIESKPGSAPGNASS